MQMSKSSLETLARRSIKLFIFPALFLFAAMPMLAQGQGMDANTGAQQFSRNCAGCHGADGRGGDKAPAIATMPSVVGLSDTDLIKIVHSGTPAGMPAFPQLNDADTRAVVYFLRTLQGKTPGNASEAVTGNSTSGRALFSGKAQCSNCHMVGGAGGFIASELTTYGQSHNEAAIVKAIEAPDNPLVAAARVVEVRTKSGQKLSGVVRSEDNFNLELQTEDGRYHFLARNMLADVHYTDHSLMPHDYGTRLTPEEMKDIASYLIVTGKAAPASPSPRGRRGAVQ
jgi:cytochrome c oxidase cbb3-type subunit 3